NRTVARAVVRAVAAPRHVGVTLPLPHRGPVVLIALEDAVAGVLKLTDAGVFVGRARYVLRAGARLLAFELVAQQLVVERLVRRRAPPGVVVVVGRAPPDVDLALGRIER